MFKSALVAAALVAFPLASRADVPDVGDTLAARTTDAVIWRHPDGTLAITTALKLLSPAYRIKARSGDADIYDGVLATPVVLLAKDGRVLMVQVSVQTAPAPGSTMDVQGPVWSTSPMEDDAFRRALDNLHLDRLRYRMWDAHQPV